MTHPITPPPELVQQWASEWMQLRNVNRDNFMATRAAQWGADQAVPEDAHGYIAWMLFEGGGELRPEAREVLTARGIIPSDRHPKPPSLKEQALAELAEWENVMDIAPDSPIRRALEQLDD
jgi:hypothetical protein